MNNSTPAIKTLSKENLMKLISTKDISVTFLKQNDNDHTSKVWLYFSSIFVENVKQDYVMCDSCMSLIAYKSSTGTGGMQKHINSCPKKSSSVGNLMKIKLHHILIQLRINQIISVRDCL
jgi:hypothetical protein